MNNKEQKVIPHSAVQIQLYQWKTIGFKVSTFKVFSLFRVIRAFDIARFYNASLWTMRAFIDVKKLKKYKI